MIWVVVKYEKMRFLAFSFFYVLGDGERYSSWFKMAFVKIKKASSLSSVGKRGEGMNHTGEGP